MTSSINTIEEPTSKSTLNTPQVHNYSSNPIWPMREEKEEAFGGEFMSDTNKMDNIGERMNMTRAPSPPVFDMDQFTNLSEFNVADIRHLLSGAPTATPDQPCKYEHVHVVSVQPSHEDSHYSVLHEFLNLGSLQRQISIPGIDELLQSTMHQDIPSFLTPTSDNPSVALNGSPDFYDTNVDLAQFLGPYPTSEVASKDNEIEEHMMEYKYNEPQPSSPTPAPRSQGPPSSSNSTFGVGVGVTVVGGKVVLKDERYWKRRNKNNEASRQSRLTRKQKQEFMEDEVVQLERRNASLRASVDKLTDMTAEWKHKLLLMMSKK